MVFSLEVMAARSSVRSYNGVPIEARKLDILIEAMATCVPGPFGSRARFAIVAPEFERHEGRGEGSLAKSGRIGTYGFISKVPAFIVGAIVRGPRALEDFGYSMEGLILKATELGLGSCWIGGLFDRGAAAKALGRKEEEILPAVVSIGMPAGVKSLAESLTRRMARAGSRKPASSLFFDGDFDRPLRLDSSPWREAFEALRMGPSASNKQPWRVVAKGGAGQPPFELYLEEDRLYNSALGEIHIQNIDMGIAMRHFESAARSLGLPGAWSVRESEPRVEPARLKYIASWEF